MGALKETIRGLLPRTQRLHRILSGPLRGMPLCTSWHDYPGALLGTTERPLLDWFARHVHAGETWLDVGAHYGYTAVALATLVGPSGRVLAFEPVPASAACIERTRQANGLDQIQVIGLALSDSATPQSLELPATRGMADRTWSGVGSQLIQHVALDSLWYQYGYSEVHGIKIDVQGMEYEALRGMTGVLRRYTPLLVVEFHRGVERDPIVTLLHECGYSRGAELLLPQRQPAAELRDDTSYVFRPKPGN